MIYLPNPLKDKLLRLSEYIKDRDKAILEGVTFEELIEEMNSALSKIELPPIPPAVKVYGNVWIDPSSKIHDQVIIKGPCIICKDAEIGPGTYIREGTIVGPGAKIGFGAEIKASIIGPNSKIAHRAYVGHTIIGKRSEISAGVVIATKRLDSAYISTFKTTGEKVVTGLKKLGAFIGDDVKISSGVLIMPGAVLGNSVTVYPNVVVRGFVRENEIVKTEIFTHKFEAIKLLAESHYKENELFWRRNAVFVTIVSALFALITVYLRLYGFEAKVVSFYRFLEPLYLYHGHRYRE